MPKERGSRASVCFYAPYLYPVVGGADVAFAGGAEVHQWLLAEGLANRGFAVTVATCDYGQPERVVRNGVTLLKTFRPQAGVRGIRFFYPRLIKAVATLRSSNADVFIAQGVGLGPALTHEVSALTRARFVLLAASDADTDPALHSISNVRDRMWHRRALRGADVVVAQTHTQRASFRSNFGIDAVRIPNPIEIPAQSADPAHGKYVLWLGTYKPTKRPDWFVALAQRLPNYRFVMAGGLPPGKNADAVWRGAQRDAERLENLDVRGFVPREAIPALLAESSLLVHTSALEGFPMTMLEAWSHGIPTVSCVDPDGVVTRERMGHVAQTLAGLTEHVAALMNNPENRRAAGVRARAYVVREHRADTVCTALGTLIEDVIAS